MKRAIGVLLVAMILLGAAFIAWWYWPDIITARNKAAIVRCAHAAQTEGQLEWLEAYDKWCGKLPGAYNVEPPP